MTKIIKKRINKLSSNLPLVKVGDSINVCLKINSEVEEKLKGLGFREKTLSEGMSVLPMPIGAVSRYNSLGKNILQKHLPKETRTRQREWQWSQWHGKNRVIKTRIVDVPYKRYQREHIAPPSVELKIATDSSGNKYVIVETEIYSESNESLLHKINLFLELFSECEVLKEGFIPFLPSQARSLNWEILPKGKLPWKKVSEAISPHINLVKKGNRNVIKHRIKHIQKYEPNFHAIGHAGFSGYIVFGFEKLGIYLLESTSVNNATYILDENWEQLSQMTKREILRQDLQKNRIIHNKTWFSKTDKLLNLDQKRAA